MKIPFFIFLVSGFIPSFGKAQSFSPRWYGRAETKTKSFYNSYLCEFVLNKKENHISGTLNYFFGQQEYGVKITGHYWPQTKTIELNPFKLISHFATSQNSPDCMVDGSLTLYTDEGDSILYGQINPVGKYRNMCPILTISLNKEILPDILPESEQEPERNVLVIESLKTQPGGASAAINATVPQVHLKEKAMQGPEFTRRNFLEGPLILADSDSITLHLYDNGQVDNDTVSVYFNREPVMFKQKLSVTPIIIKLVLKPGENEIAMFADNLGDIPPNTALCLIFAGGKRYDINLVSNFAANGTVRIKRRNELP